jgi:hypothetical protein
MLGLREKINMTFGLPALSGPVLVAAEHGHKKQPFSGGYGGGSCGREERAPSSAQVRLCGVRIEYSLRRRHQPAEMPRALNST